MSWSLNSYPWPTAGTIRDIQGTQVRGTDERSKSSEEFQFPWDNELENYNYFSLI